MPGNERSGEPPKIPTGWHQFQFRIVRDARGRKRKTIFKMDTEDIVAIGAVLIALYSCPFGECRLLSNIQPLGSGK